MSSRAATLLFVLLAANAPAAQQWQSTPRSRESQLQLERNCILESDASGVRAFSWQAGRWQTVGEPGATLADSGAWCALVRDARAWHAWSARRAQSASVPFEDASSGFASDDLALVITPTGQNQALARAWSAQTNTWQEQGLGWLPGAADIALSASVAIVRDIDGYHGFSARTGRWRTLALLALAAPPQARGDLGWADLSQTESIGQALPHLAAFSGVHGNWSLSPLWNLESFAAGDQVLGLFHVDALGQRRAAGYSAYSGTWSLFEDFDAASPRARLESGAAWLALHDEGDRPQAFFGAGAGDWTLLEADADWRLDMQGAIESSGQWALSERPGSSAASAELRGWSALAPLGVAGLARLELPLPIELRAAGERIALVASGSGSARELRAFAPGLPSFSLPAPAPVAESASAASAWVAFESPGAGLRALSARNFDWIAGASPAAGAAVEDAFVGNLLARRWTSGAQAGRLELCDLRGAAWLAFDPFAPAGTANASDYTQLAGESLLVLEPGPSLPTSSGIRAWSAARGSWSDAPVGLRSGGTLACSGEVACFDDGAGQWWAIGSGAALELEHAWPMHADFARAGLAPEESFAPRQRLVARGEPGLEYALLFWSGFSTEPLALVGLEGFACLAPNAAQWLAGPLSIPPGGLVALELPLAYELPFPIELWAQAAFVAPLGWTARLGERCVPLRIF